MTSSTAAISIAPPLQGSISSRMASKPTTRRRPPSALSEPTSQPYSLSSARRQPSSPTPYKAGHYHPRIALERSRLFARFPEELQERWRAVSDDYYYVRHNELFRTTALLRLGALTSHTRLLLCAEDLG